VGELPDGQATIWCKIIPEKLNTLTDDRQIDRQTDGFAMGRLAKKGHYLLFIFMHLLF